MTMMEVLRTHQELLPQMEWHVDAQFVMQMVDNPCQDQSVYHRSVLADDKMTRTRKYVTWHTSVNIVCKYNEKARLRLAEAIQARIMNAWKIQSLSVAMVALLSSQHYSKMPVPHMSIPMHSCLYNVNKVPVDGHFLMHSDYFCLISLHTM